MKDLCFIDVETTGTVFGYHELIEIAAIRTSPDAFVTLGTWQERVKPQHPERISEYAQQLNGFNVDEWSTAHVPDQDFWREFARFAQGAQPVCHNPSFDRAFLSLAAIAQGVSEIGLDHHWIGTESLAWPLYCRGRFSKLSLAALCDFLGIEREPDLHRAIDGARACRSVYVALMSRFAEAEVRLDPAPSPSGL
jgi:DNA polymerase III epsilon subunit-like protein